ncbi:Histidine kinase-like ATPase domain-containing protein [Streptomyces sp. 2224.1]|uniref:SpoIIE family protein phosphatase/ATP-binding protein n=1 Tax=unclassified Streptomyces TaxID=2593676 RepID=UPI0008850863|nr:MULTISPECIES: SpoIIE family protein phosphatase/ATP-binding protein [unclassified Streptomyces]PBC86802.1 histidine kinase-like protein [Streptomyces sp. 2321.6]SDQ71946.1 Histidine kinase-like ATPase domain-containing protein [Streptomyces sp. KS_16]SED43773.1 Histidine kinase-like ATPase domain-containing protein [Streptomyces sp. 2112.3]SED81375.1 Histidine kinase-like ATPase domain-containing protein [Streptomyces sp. 2224.1]SEE09873.1 Histidine kinase-like ATPase domain-containing prot
MAGRYGRPRSVLRMRTVAGQVFLLQVAIVVLLVAAAIAALVLQSRADGDREARNRSVAVAEAFANAPGIEEALKSANPTLVLQPRTEAARKRSEVDFIVVMNTQGIRYTHPIPNRIGKKFVGTLKPALSGGVVTERITGTIGPLVQAVVPVFGHSGKDKGKVVGLVSAGITVKRVSGVVDDQFPLLFGAAAGVLLLTTGGTALVSRRLRRQTHGLGPAEMTRMYEHHDAVLHAVREGVIIVAGDGSLLLVNDEARRLLDLPPDVEGRQVGDLGLDPATARLLASGRAVTDEVHPVGERLLAINQRSTDQAGGPPGSVTTLRDTTELRALTGRADVARGRLKLLYDAGTEIGTTLDVVRTCEELAEFGATRFADIVTVDVAEDVLIGEEPTAPTGAAIEMRRTATSGAPADSGLYPVGKLIRFEPATTLGASLTTGKAALEADLSAFSGWHLQSPGRARKIVAHGIHSRIAVPLRARGVILGVAIFWRSHKPEPFEDEELSLAEELVARAAVSIDNARRYTREHAMAVTLQRSLLPRGLPEQNAVEAAYRYLPAQAGLGGLGGVGGDWFDIIPLPGARVALVVGDVVGHGLHAAATMGRLRTAVHNFANLDLPPDEILWHLDELVTRIDQDESAEEAEGSVTGATCLYAIYDPASGNCTMARAGHVQPMFVLPDGTAEVADVPGGPPLGLGGLPFETWQRQLPEESRLVLFTDGLVEDRDRDLDEGMALLSRTLSDPAGRTPEETCEVVLDALLPERPSDDIALLVARTRVLDTEHVADWDVPPDPSAVAQVRAAAVRKLIEWGLAEGAFTAELILSELVTNSIRYAAGPIRVRLIRDTSLICEVSDRSSTSPHLRQAASMDEGGRGLFLVAQLAERWGTRYTSGGKVIWTEQALTGLDLVAERTDGGDA